METVDPRRQFAADRYLQREITAALEGLADSLPACVDVQLVHILAAILEPAWDEHTRFQDEALFPMLLRRSGRDEDVVDTVQRLRVEHMELAERHIEVTQQIGLLVQGHLRNFESFGYLLRSAFERRRSHMDSETRLEKWLEGTLSASERALLGEWRTRRTLPPFPASLLLGRLH